MSLPKVPLKAVWLKHDVYQALVAICESTDGRNPSAVAAEWITDRVTQDVRKASMVHQALEASGSLKYFAEEEGDE